MVAEVLIFILGAIVLFELVEHVVFPIAAVVAARKRPAVTGAEGMVGKTAVVKRWSGKEGQVAVDGELWTAIGDEPLLPDEAAIVRGVQGLTLRVSRLDRETGTRVAETSPPRS